VRVHLKSFWERARVSFESNQQRRRLNQKKAHIKPSLPTDRGVLPVQTQKEYIKINALENIHSVPKKVAQKDPLYISKPSYGKVPAYLAKRISSQQQESVECAANITNQQSNAAWRGQIEAGIVPLPEDERLKVLDGLKANWTRLNSDYQKLSLTVDTVPKIARKVNMEQQLKQLEEQMAKFSHANILVDFNSAWINIGIEMEGNRIIEMEGRVNM